MGRLRLFLEFESRLIASVDGRKEGRIQRIPRHLTAEIFQIATLTLFLIFDQLKGP